MRSRNDANLRHRIFCLVAHRRRDHRDVGETSEDSGKKLNPIATESFKDFYLHHNKTFLEGGYNKRADLADWVRMKGFAIS